MLGLGFPIHARHPAPRAGHARHTRPFSHHRPAHPGTLGQCQGNPGRIALPVLGQIDAAGNALKVHMLIAVANLGSTDFLDIDAKGAGHGGRAGQLLQPLDAQSRSD